VGGEEMSEEIKLNLNSLLLIIGKTSHEHCVNAGFPIENDDCKDILLVHSELSEAVEYLRMDNPKSNHIPDFSGVEEELADAVIRICNYAYCRGFNLGDAIIAKLQFNETREPKHGGKKF
jgi:NTP pyrophosphatase (non-canonical NTP hydrolase)